jgi:hypothetical protein
MDILPQHNKFDGIYRQDRPITVKNVDIKLKSYSNGKNTVIAYGGGVDSTSIALLFPEFPIVHSSNFNDSLEIKKVMKGFIKNDLKNDSYIIDSNCKELTKPTGFTTFTNIFIIPLILSSDLNIKNICCGEVLGSSCLSNGNKYFPQFNPKRRNRWLRFYNQIGLYMFSPTAGCSELFTSKVIFKNNLVEKVLFCESNQGYPCYKCTKCLRKLLEFKLHGYNYDFKKFNNNTMSIFLKKRPLYFSHIFIETIKNIEGIPIYMKESIKDIINTRTDIFHKIYSKSFIYFPEDIKDKLINELTKYAEIMSEEEEKYLESWDMTIEKFNNFSFLKNYYLNNFITYLLLIFMIIIIIYICKKCITTYNK